MNAIRPTGLGEPELSGKISLFQPPKGIKSETNIVTQEKEPEQKSKNTQVRRIHTTLDLTWEALQVIQEIQRRHRLKTGKVLPQWKAVSQAIVGYSQAKRGSKPAASEANPA